MNIETTFPARYWINLGRREDRRFETEWQLEQAGISAERLAAVDARFVRRSRGYESAGRYALALTQRIAIRKAMLAGVDAVLIFEDDVVFHPDFRERLSAIELPDDWGIFYPGCAHRVRPTPVGHGLVRTRYALDTHAFAVRAPYFRQVIAALDARHRRNRACEHALASDWFLADLHDEIPTYACYPNLAWQAVAKSDLAKGTYSNYTESGEQIASHGVLRGLQAEMWGGTPWQNRDDESSEMAGGWTGLSRVISAPRLGLLFLTDGDVNLPDVWREFAEQAGDSVRVFSNALNVQIGDSGFLSGSGMNAPQEFAGDRVSEVRAMMDLLRRALEDDSLTHFVFLSESCVPIRPWAEISRRLRMDPRSWLGSGMKMLRTHRERISAVKDLPARCQRAHAPWCLLARDAAECVTEFDFTGHFECIPTAHEHYIGSVLALRGFDEARRIVRRPVTWVRWSEADGISKPDEWDVVDAETAAELAAFEGFFARKFTRESDIARWGLHQAGIDCRG